MNSPKKFPECHRTPTAVLVSPASSPRFPASTPTAGARRKIGIAVDLSDKSACTVKWAVHNYLRHGDAVILIHVQPTSVLYGADWGAIDVSLHEAEGETDRETQKRNLEIDFDTLTITKTNDLAGPLVEAKIPFKVHIVKDHDMEERLCLEVERLGLSTLIINSLGCGASKPNAKGRLGSVSDYCVRHCVCPVVVVRFPDEEKDGKSDSNGGDDKKKKVAVMEEDDQEYHDALEKQ